MRFKNGLNWITANGFKFQIYLSCAQNVSEQLYIACCEAQVFYSSAIEKKCIHKKIKREERGKGEIDYLQISGLCG